MISQFKLEQAIAHVKRMREQSNETMLESGLLTMMDIKAALQPYDDLLDLLNEVRVNGHR